MYKKSYEIEGYVLPEEMGMDVVCKNCGTKLVREKRVKLEDTIPIFADSEWDSAPVCDVCEKELGVSIVEDD